MPPLRIAADARYLNGQPSGIARYSENLLLALAELNPPAEWHVLVQPGYAPPPALAQAMQFHPFPHAPLSRATLLQAGRFIDALGCALVHFHCPIVPLRLRTPYAVTLHDWQPLTEPGFSAGRAAPVKFAYDQFYRWAYPRAARGARAILNVSHATHADTCRFVPAAAARSHAIPSGLERFFRELATAAEVAEARAAFHLPVQYALFVGSSRPNKQFPTLLRALAQLRSRQPDAQLIAVVNRDRFFPALQQLTLELGLHAAVTFLHDLPDPALRGLYRGAQVFVLPSTGEGFGFPLLEAMAQGTPCIIANDGSLTELAAATAIRVPPCEPPALAAALERLLADSHAREAHEKVIRARALEYNWQTTAAQTWACLRSAAGMQA